MTVTTFPNHPSGAQKVKARILADTVCQPHGIVSAGQVVEVTTDEFQLLRHANKAELHVEPQPEDSGTKSMSLDEFKAALDSRTKAALVELAKQEFSLDLSESSTKQQLTDAIVEVALKGKG